MREVYMVNCVVQKLNFQGEKVQMGVCASGKDRCLACVIKEDSISARITQDRYVYKLKYRVPPEL